MKAQEYRRQVEKDLEQAPAARQGDKIDADWDGLLAVLDDPAQPSDARQAALRTLQAASFLGARFNAVRPAFIDVLRSAATDSDAGLRRAALDVLANIKDSFAQERLRAGLTGDSEPLVPAAVALGMLARDDHASLSSLALSILAGDADRFARAQAVRILGSDPSARDLLARLMGDKDEFREVRRASAIALRELDPQIFLREGRKILSDSGDFQDIKATVRGALKRSGQLRTLAGQRIDQGAPFIGRLLRSFTRWGLRSARSTRARAADRGS